MLLSERKEKDMLPDLIAVIGLLVLFVNKGRTIMVWTFGVGMVAFICLTNHHNGESVSNSIKKDTPHLL